MRWKGRRQSTNVEDRRGMGGYGGLFGGGVRSGRRSQNVGKGGGIGSLIIMLLLAVFFGKDISLDILGGDTGYQATPDQTVPNQAAQRTPRTAAEQEEIVSFVKVVLAETEETWAQIFAQSGQRYRAPKLVLFDDSTPTACGTGRAASGPFYCPGDQKIYIDLDFMGDLQRMGAQGDFAFAYVIAHEVGHHIQTVMGISERVQRLKQSISKTEANALQVKMELQADCLAGLWANHTERRNAILEEGDVQEGINAAAAVGDDRISGGRLSRKHYTHGSSQERMNWFMQGLKHGDINKCDTFSQARF